MSETVRRRASMSGPAGELADRTRRLEARQMRMELEVAEKARLCAEYELRMVKARLREVENELAAVRGGSTVDVSVQTADEMKPCIFGRRLGGREDPVALALENDLAGIGQAVSTSPLLFVSPKGSKEKCINDEYELDDSVDEEESLRTTAASDEVVERDLRLGDILSTTESLGDTISIYGEASKKVINEAAVPKIEKAIVFDELRPHGRLAKYAANTGCGVAMAMVLGGNELLRSNPFLSDWARAAVATEAEHISRRDDEKQGKRVRFAHYNLSAVPPPIDTVRDSEIEARAVAKRLADAVQAGEKLVAADSTTLQVWVSGLRAVSEHADALTYYSAYDEVFPDEIQVRGAASLWIAEAESLLAHNKDSSPIRLRLSEILSSLLRHDLRRLLNPPPPPGTKPAFLNDDISKRAPLGERSPNDTMNDLDEDFSQRPNTRGSQRRKKKSRRASIISSIYDADDEAHPFAWCRSAAHKLIVMDCLDDDSAAHGIPEGSIASQVTTALHHLSRAPPPLIEPNQDILSPKTTQDLESGWRRLDIAAARLNAACGVRFLHKLFHFPKLDSVLNEVGGWSHVEKYAAMAVDYGHSDIAAQFAPLRDIALLKSLLKDGLNAAEKDRRAAQTELSALVRAFANKRRLTGSKQLAQAASAVARNGMLYPDLKPALP